MAKINKNCLYCSKTFSVGKAVIKIGKGKYCSRKCCLKHKYPDMNVSCRQCGASFVKKVSYVRNQGGVKYCSRSCTSKSTKNALGHKFNAEQLHRLSEAHKGHVTWSKGIKLPYDVWNKGIKLPERSKENNPRWVKDRTKLVKSEKKHEDSQYKIWMLGVKGRDEWKCRISNSECAGRLEAHHILNWVDYPELRYKSNNGITLCQAHHPRGRAKEKQLAPYFQELVLASKE